MNLVLQRESFDNSAAWLASEKGKIVKTGGITLSQANKAPDNVTGKRIYRSGEFVGLLLNQGSLSGLYGTYGTGRRAILQTALAGVNNDILWTARAVGTGGNSITIAYVDPGGNNQALSVSVNVAAISVSLATGPAGAITSTANQIIAAVRANAAADALVHGEIPPGNTGHGVVVALGATNLAGGTASCNAAATLATGVVANNNAITWTAVTTGASGNNIQVALSDPGANNAVLAISVTGAGTSTSPYVVDVSLATNAGGAITTTAAQAIEAVNNHGMARTLVRGANTGASTGAAAVVDVNATALASGTDPNVSLAAGEFGLLTHDVDVTDGDAIGGLLYGGKVLSARLPSTPTAPVIAALPHVMFTTENS